MSSIDDLSTLLTFLHCKHLTRSKCRATEFSSLLSISVITEFFFFPRGAGGGGCGLLIWLLLPSSDKLLGPECDPDMASGWWMSTSSTPTTSLIFIISSSSWKEGEIRFTIWEFLCIIRDCLSTGVLPSLLIQLEFFVQYLYPNNNSQF